MDARILSFDGGNIHEIAYEDSEPYHIARRFTADCASFLDDLFQETPSLFPEE